MKMLRTGFLTGLFTHIFSSLFAQQVSPKLYVSNAETTAPVPFSAVTFMLPDSTGAVSLLTDSVGMVALPRGWTTCFILSFDAIGYRKRIEGKFCPPFSPVTNIAVRSASKTLNAVTIESRKNLVTIDGEKKVFDVSSSIAAVTGNATQVLQQVPAVNVDMDGNISLRGNANVLVYINGKPSGLTGGNRQAILDQIPAANIDKIEVITNPSARYEADGMAGIINIVLKKNQQRGFNLNISPGVGSNNKYQENITLGYKTRNVSTSVFYSLRQQATWGEGYALRDNYFTDTTFRFVQYMHSFNLPVTHNARVSSEWNINKNNSLSVGINVSSQNQKQEENYQYLNYSPETVFQNLWARSAITYSNNKTAEQTFNFKHNFPRKGHEISLSTNLSYNENFGGSTFYDRGIENRPASLDATLYNPINALFRIYTGQADYVLPLSNDYKFESGVRINHRQLQNDFDLLNGTGAGDWTPIPGRSNQYRYTETVSAAYAIFSRKKEAYSWQMGLRTENTRMLIRQVTNDSSITRLFTDWFPNANINYAINSHNDLQFSLSRRLNRPGPQNLNPFADYTDALNIRVGNPYLKPEYIHAAELSWLGRKANFSWVITGYYRYLNNALQRYRVALPSGLSVVYFRNFSHSQNTGFEGTLKADPFNWLSMSLNGNVFYMKLKGSSRESDLSNDVFSYSCKLLASIKMPYKIDLQLTSVYNGPNALLQGYFGAVYGTDIGVRKDLMKGKLSLVANLSDVFDQRLMRIYTESTNFTSDNRRKRESRILMLSASYRLGQSENKKRQGRETQGENFNNDAGGW